MALTGALCASMHAVTGFTNKSLRGLVAGLLDDSDYTTNQMTYDLRRLRLHGLIDRIPRTNTYTLTGDEAPASPSSTPRSTTGSCAPSSPPTNHPHHHQYEKHCTP